MKDRLDEIMELMYALKNIGVNVSITIFTDGSGHVENSSDYKRIKSSEFYSVSDAPAALARVLRNAESRSKLLEKYPEPIKLSFLDKVKKLLGVK